MATLIGSRALRPPLAIGLYGEWGAGKTFFMHVLEQEIDNYIKIADANHCRGVRSVWFNAWQYAEADMRASLIHHVFKSLWRTDSLPEQYAEAVKQVEGAQRFRAEAEGLRVAAQQEVSEATRAVEVAEQAHEDAESATAKLKASDIVAAICVDPEARRDLNQAADRLGIPAAGDSVREAQEAAQSIRDLVAHGRRLAAAGPLWKTPLVVGGAVMIIGIALTYLIGRATGWFDSSYRTIFPLVGALTSAVSAIAAWLRRQAALGRQLLEPAERVQRQIVARREELERGNSAELAKLHGRLERATIALEAAHQRLALATANEAAAIAHTADLDSDRLLERYLADRAASGEYDRYLGSAALAFRDLRDLSEHLTNAASSPDSTAADRIVLYIDDLDRCSPSVVAKVLESVHLLLSLPLFVVVVGVDPHWLLESIADSHPSLASEGAAQPLRRVNASAVDYLDKIFQLSYRVPAMSADQTADFLERVAADSQPTDSSAGGGTPDAESPDVDQPEAVAESAASVQPASASAGPSAPEEYGRLAARGLVLSGEEMNIVRAVGPLVGTSPRRAKRFLNTYRILKARALIDAANRDAAENPDSLSALIVLTALCVGLPRRIPALLDASGSAAAASEGRTLEAWIAACRKADGWTGEEARRLGEFNDRAGALLAVPMAEVDRWVAMSRRFSWPVR